MNKSWNDRADKELFYAIINTKDIGVISGAEWSIIGSYMRTIGYGFTNEGCRQHFQGLRRNAQARPSSSTKADPVVNPIARRPGPGRGRPRKEPVESGAPVADMAPDLALPPSTAGMAAFSHGSSGGSGDVGETAVTTSTFTTSTAIRPELSVPPISPGPAKDDPENNPVKRRRGRPRKQSVAADAASAAITALVTDTAAQTLLSAAVAADANQDSEVGGAGSDAVGGYAATASSASVIPSVTSAISASPPLMPAPPRQTFSTLPPRMPPLEMDLGHPVHPESPSQFPQEIRTVGMNMNGPIAPPFESTNRGSGIPGIDGRSASVGINADNDSEDDGMGQRAAKRPRPSAPVFEDEAVMSVLAQHNNVTTCNPQFYSEA